MKIVALTVLIGTSLGVGVAVGVAQPAPNSAAAPEGSGSGTMAGSAVGSDASAGSAASAGSGSASGEPTFEPEHVSAEPPPRAAAPSNQPLTVDQLVIASVNRIDLNFFGDVSLLDLTDAHPAFSIGPLGFQVTAHLADGLVGRAEYAMAFESGSTVVDVERAYLEYRVGRWILTGGRTHSDLGYWNNAFHHGRWLQLTIHRPRVIRFEDEGGMLAVHQVGFTATHAPARGEHGLEISAGVGNGHGPSIVEVQTTGDNNLAKSVVLRVGAVGIGDEDLRFGVNLSLDKIAAEDATTRPLLPGKPIFEVVTGAYVALRSNPWIVLGEVYDVVHHAASTTWQITDGFLLGGYRIGNNIPYAQLELRRGDGLVDPFYNPDPMGFPEATQPSNYVEGIAGLHHDLNTWSALKVELAGRRFETLGTGGTVETRNEYRAELNWSFGR